MDWFNQIFAFWISSHFTTTIQYDARNTANDASVLLISCSMLFSMNKTLVDCSLGVWSEMLPQVKEYFIHVNQPLKALNPLLILEKKW